MNKFEFIVTFDRNQKQENFLLFYLTYSKIKQEKEAVNKLISN